MQANTEKRLAGLKDKIPDIQKTLDAVQFLSKRKVCLAQTLLGGSYLLHPNSQIPTP